MCTLICLVWKTERRSTQKDAEPDLYMIMNVYERYKLGRKKQFVQSSSLNRLNLILRLNKK